ncbi:MAG: YbjP/YqhG family protein [Tannerellaceae bacterium]|jgi:hypothetical protein|nr:YbjP/YqhG family protein [Tannerellaceae bacterium]
MKAPIILLLSTLLLAGCKVKSPNDQAINMLNEFYTAYIVLCETSHSDDARQGLLEKYCTANCLRQLEAAELDYDPIINAQDCNAAWLDSLAVDKDPAGANVFVVSYASPYGGKTSIRLALTEETNGLKINSIL